MGLAAAYRTKFLKQDLIKRNQIRRGDILIGKYKSKRTGKVSNKVSFVLDWVPFKGNIAERKLYVFDLDKFSFTTLIDFIFVILLFYFETPWPCYV